MNDEMGKGYSFDEQEKVNGVMGTKFNKVHNGEDNVYVNVTNGKYVIFLYLYLESHTATKKKLCRIP